MGLKEPEKLQIAPESAGRLLLDQGQRARELFGQFPYGYGAVLGTYQNIFIGKSVERKGPNQLSGIELIIADHINQLLVDRQGNRPVVFVDFGGMFSLTSARLAQNFTKLIEKSQLVLVVTNLGISRDDLVKNMDKNVVLRENQDLRMLFLSQQQRIHFLASDAQNLHEKKLVLPNGKTIRLDGNVDFLIENNTLGFSGMPERDMAFLGDLLSEDGLFFSGTDQPEILNLGCGDINLWHIAYNNGVEYLHGRGLKELKFSREDPTFRVFIGSKAKAPSSLVDYLI